MVMKCVKDGFYLGEKKTAFRIDIKWEYIFRKYNATKNNSCKIIATKLRTMAAIFAATVKRSQLKRWAREGGVKRKSKYFQIV